MAAGTSYTLTASRDGRTASESGLVLSDAAPTLHPVLTLDTSPPLTAATPVGGTYPVAQSVELTCSDDRSACVATHYTVDGSTPTTSSPLYAAPISVSDTTLQFFSIDGAGNVESVRTEVYVVDSTCYTLSRTKTGEGDLPQPSVGNSADCPAGQYHADEVIDLTAVPASGWRWGVGPEPRTTPARRPSTRS